MAVCDDFSWAMSEVFPVDLVDRFGSRGLRVGTPPDAIAVFPAKHPEVGDVSIRGAGIDSATVAVGEILVDHFYNLDSHLDAHEVPND
jgi:hypothetical protein